MLGAAVDWQAITVAGGFVLGVIVGALGTIRVMRVVAGYLRRDP